MSSQIFNLWLAGLVSVFSTIWFARNQAFNHDTLLPFSKAMILVGAAIKEENRDQKVVMANYVSDLVLFSILGVSALRGWLLILFEYLGFGWLICGLNVI